MFWVTRTRGFGFPTSGVARDNLPQPTGDLQRQYPSTENVLSRGGRSVEIRIRVISLDPSNETYEKICDPQMGGSAHQITHPGRAFISITHHSTWSKEGSRRVDQLLRSRSQGRDTRADRVDARDLRRLNASVISRASQASGEWCWHWHREDMELPRFRLVWPARGGGLTSG